MKDKKILIYLSMVFVFTLTLFMLFRNNTQSFKRLSASVSPEEEKNIIIEKSKLYINDNISKFDGDSVITLNDLILNGYLTNQEIEDVTYDLYDKETRIFFTVKDSNIEDIYLKDELFSKIFKCMDICYINDNNYIYYNNDLYQILRVDSNGNIYITNNEIKNINYKDIDIVLRNKINELDRKIGDSVDIINSSDISNSNFIKIEKDILVSSSTGYKIYDINLNEIKDVDVDNVDIMFVIKLANTLNYKMGDGTKFNPYIISE